TYKVIATDEAFTIDDQGIEILREKVRECRPAIVVIDPIVAFFDGDPNKPAAVRAFTNRLKPIAEEFGCAIIMVRHVGKAKGQGDPRAAGLYSIEWRAAARSELIFGADPEDPKATAMVQNKPSLSPPDAAGIGYRIESVTDHGIETIPQD